MKLRSCKSFQALASEYVSCVSYDHVSSYVYSSGAGASSGGLMGLEIRWNHQLRIDTCLINSTHTVQQSTNTWGISSPWSAPSALRWTRLVRPVARPVTRPAEGQIGRQHTAARHLAANNGGMGQLSWWATVLALKPVRTGLCLFSWYIEPTSCGSYNHI